MNVFLRFSIQLNLAYLRGGYEYIFRNQILGEVSLTLSSTLWQEVKGALWPLHPDLTGLSASKAILFLLSPHRDLAQLLSDLKQEVVDSHRLYYFPFTNHLCVTDSTLVGYVG